MIPRLMDHTKALSALAADTTNGLGSLAEAASCIVTEERNGGYTLQMKLPITAKHYSEVTVGGVIKAKANEFHPDQLFRIQKISRPINGMVTIYANHISYDLGKTSIAPFTTTGASATMTALKANMTGGAAFTLTTDVPNVASSFTNGVPQSLRACLGGQRGSVLDVFGGEYEWNNLSVKLCNARGSNRGVVLRYGKNITDIQQDENIENTYTAVMPYAIDSAGTVTLGTLQTIIVSAEPKILNLDLSDKFDDNNPPTQAGIDQAAQDYIDSHNLTQPKINITVSFVALWQTEEYKEIAPLERVALCDTVTVKFEKLGISATAKVIETRYNTLTERYDSIELGDAKSTLAQTINGIDDRIDAVANQKISFMDQTIASFSQLIANGMGLFMTGEDAGGGAMKWYLHNKPARIDSQYQWTVNASGFAVSSDYGATWSAGFDAEGNAVFNSLAANIIKAMQIYAGTLTFGEDTTTTLSDNADDTGALFQGDGTMEFQTKGQFYAQNLYSGGNLANSIQMNAADANNATFEMQNTLNSGSAYKANRILLDKAGQNREALLENYQSLTTDWANQLDMNAGTTEQSIAIRNRYVGSSATANILQMTSSDTEARTNLQNATTDSGLIGQLFLSSFDGEAPAALTVRSSSWMSGIYIQDDGTIQIAPHGDLELTIGNIVLGKVRTATISGKTVLVLE